MFLSFLIIKLLSLERLVISRTASSADLGKDLLSRNNDRVRGRLMGIDEFYEGVSMQTTTGLGSETLQERAHLKGLVCVY